MSYEDRLRFLTYTSPSGAEFVLDFDSLERTGGKKAPDNEAPGQKGGPIQDLGERKVSYPIKCYIHGADYDEEADRFWNALAETGPARIEHPRWGNIIGIPTNRTQREEFVQGVGEAVFDFTFIEAPEGQFEFPFAFTDTSALTQAAADSAALTAIASAPDDVDDIGLIESIKNWTLNILSPITSAYDNITDITDEVRQEITQAVADIQSEIDTLANNTARLTEDLLYIYRLPARLEISIKNKIAGYVAIYESMSDILISTTEKYGSWFGINAANQISGVMVAAADSASAGTSPTRDDAAEAVAALTALAEAARTTIEDLEAAGDFVADYELIAKTEIAVSSAINGLINRALELPAEQTMTLEREVDPLTLAYELFGDVDDDTMDEFIEYNNFCCNEILMIPRGRVVRWYV